ncbi:GspH/FimT family pseudopilin [Endozoicomonas sp. SCSIO W0465]|nr:GspH/FimT family pseudopilin [Endozoicomonas sp. SCSIO W0465]
MHFARSEAAANSTAITVCSSSDATTCDGGDWSNGFIILEDSEVLQVFDGLEAVS